MLLLHKYHIGNPNPNPNPNITLTLILILILTLNIFFVGRSLVDVKWDRNLFENRYFQ